MSDIKKGDRVTCEIEWNGSGRVTSSEGDFICAVGDKAYIQLEAGAVEVDLASVERAS